MACRLRKTTKVSNLNLQLRSLVLRVDPVSSRRTWLVTLDRLSIQTDPEGTRRIDWMINSHSDNTDHEVMATTNSLVGC
jgi:hypothetical protein